MKTSNDTHTNQKAMLQLLELDKDLTARLQRLTADLSKTHSADSAEQAVERENDEVLEQLRHETEVELHQIKHALDRLKEGTYFTCEECGGEISEGRLGVVPYTELCIDCADKAN